MLTIADKYAYFVHALDRCGCFLLDASDEDIGYNLFEEFDGDCRAFLCEVNLGELAAAGYISHEVAHMARMLVAHFLQMENTVLWNVRMVQSAPEWLAVLTLADRIKAEIQNHVMQ